MGLSSRDRQILERLVRGQHALERRISRSERSHDAAVGLGAPVVDSQGAVVGRVGGPDTPAPEADPVAPLPTPAAPSVNVEAGVVVVHLDGLDAEGLPAPAGVVMARVYASLEAGFTPSAGSYQGMIVGPGGRGSVPLGLAAGVWHVRVVWAGASGQESAPSAPVVADLEPLVDAEDIEQALAVAQGRLDAVKAALGALSGPLTPMLAGVLPDTEGRVYYQKDEAGEIVSAWQVVNGAWVQQPLDSAVLVRVTTDQLVAGMGLIGGVLIEDDAVTAKHITASESLTAKVAKFLKVKADQIDVNDLAASRAFIGALSTSGLSLTQTINGLTTTLSGAGMVVSRQSEGGLPLPLVQVGGGTGTTVATYDADGTMLGGLGEDGSVTATDLSSQNDPLLAGAPLLGRLGSHVPSDYGVAWFDQIGWGEVANGVRTDHDAGTYAAGEHGLLQLNFTALPGRKYRVWADFGHLVRNGQTIRCRVRYTSDGATPDLNATVLEEQGFGGASGPWNAISFWTNLVGSSGENGQPIPVKLLMSISSSAGMNFVAGTGWKNLRMVVEDVGPIRPLSGIVRHVYSLVGEASGGSDQIAAPTTRTYTTTWEPNGFASYYAGGTTRQTSGPGASMMKQGLDSYAPSLGQQTSLMWITGNSVAGETGKTVTGALAGATLKSGTLLVRNQYSAAGGTKTVRLHWHGHTSAPGSYNPTGGFIGEYNVAPGSRVSIPLPANVLAALKNGSIRGFGFSAGGSTAARYNQGLSWKYKPTLTLTYER